MTGVQCALPILGVTIDVAIGRGYGAGFSLLGLLGSNGGSVSGYNGGGLCLCSGLPFDLWC